MNQELPHQYLSYPFIQVSNQKGRPDLSFSFHSGIEEDGSATVEMNSDLYASVDPANNEGSSTHSQLPGGSISTSIDYFYTAKAQEPVTPPTQGVHAHRGRVSCASWDNRQQLRALRPASTRIRKQPPEMPCVPETKTTAAQPRKKAAKTGTRRVAKPPSIIPAAAVEASTVTLCEEEQFMQLLRDTIESNKNARNRRRAPLLAEDPSVYTPLRNDSEQTPQYLDMKNDRTPTVTKVGQQPVLDCGNRDNKVVRLRKKGLRDASGESFIQPLRSEAHNHHQVKRAHAPFAEALIPALQVVDTRPSDTGAVVTAPAAAHVSNFMAHKLVLAWFR